MVRTQQNPGTDFIRLVLLCAAVTLSASASVAGESTLPRLRSLPPSGWVVSDFNGDHTPDLALSTSSRGDVPGFQQHVRIVFGVSRETSFEFHSRSSYVQLRARDIDGDHDRDIVIQEPLSLAPIGVWINDGAGNFHEGNLADYKNAFRGRGNVSADLPGGFCDESAGMLEQDAPSVITGQAAARRQHTGREVFAYLAGPSKDSELFGTSSRAPPSLG